MLKLKSRHTRLNTRHGTLMWPADKMKLIDLRWRNLISEMWLR